MTVRVVALVTVNDDAPMSLGKYFEATAPLMEKVGARIVERFNVDRSIVGAVPAQTVLVVEYPDMKAVQDVFESKEYREVTEYRDRAFSTYSVSIVSNDETEDDTTKTGITLN